MRLPTYDELSEDEEQLNVLEAPLDKPLFVVGPPGSGKTSLAAWRGDALADLYGSTPVLTYNRMLRRSLHLVAEEHEIDIRASTMQSYVWKDYRRRARAEVPTVGSDPYAYDWGEMIAAWQTPNVSMKRLSLTKAKTFRRGSSPMRTYSSQSCCRCSPTKNRPSDRDVRH